MTLSNPYTVDASPYMTHQSPFMPEISSKYTIIALLGTSMYVDGSRCGLWDGGLDRYLMYLYSECEDTEDGLG